MGIRFAKSIKLGNLVKLNISKSGISATVGKKGASINIGGKGTYLNLSPSAVGVSGTGVSYRKKLTSGLSGILSNLMGKKDDVKEETVEAIVQDKPEVDNSEIEKYQEGLQTRINIHKYADNVLNEEALKQAIDNMEQEAVKQIYQSALSGNEDDIESLVGSVLDNLELDYEVNANYELEDDVLYVDLDLPEIEDFPGEYPALVKDKVVIKKKSANELKEEYGKSVIGLGIYLASEFFNVSSYIKQIVLSAFTTRRNKDGDQVDEYLYSVKYLRETFENQDLSKVDDALKFLLQFENRINVSTGYSFKTIKPYEMDSQVKANSLIDEAIAGLKSLGYKADAINTILPSLNEVNYETSSEYLKYALSLLNKS